ncbi:MAG: hypothetical protein JNM91_11685, partial [Flavobacteriales bacterium]|nr:hypothetical protein [Flavobacteriales bacterium]
TENFRHLFLAKYPLTSGTPLWVITAKNGANNNAGGAACDDAGVYLTGEFTSTSLSWFKSDGTAMGGIAGSGTNTNVYAVGISNSGDMLWAQAFNSASAVVPKGRAVAVGCGTVYFTGSIANGSSFPGIGAQTEAAAGSAYLYLAALRRDNGTVSQLKTGYSTAFPTAISGVDLSVLKNGSVYLTGYFQQEIRLAGLVQTLANRGRDLFIARFTSYLQPEWITTVNDTGDEDPTCLAVTNSGSIFHGGAYANDLSLPPHNLDNDEIAAGLFLARINDQEPALYPRDPSKWSPPGPVCANSGALDLSTLLRPATRGYATAVSGTVGTVTNPTNVEGAPNGSSAVIMDLDGSISMDLGITLNAGDQVWITWGEYADLLALGNTAYIYIDESLDGATWTANPLVPSHNYILGNPTSITTPVPLVSVARYIRLRRSAPPALQSRPSIDAITYRTGNLLNGSWSGGPYVTAAGLFTPPAVPGSYPVAYTVNVGTCSFSTIRNIVVSAAPVAGTLAISGTPNCTTASGTLVLTGYTGTITHWERSTDGVNWSTIANTTPTQTWTNAPVGLRFRARVSTADCGSVVSNTVVVGVPDTTGPTLICPPPIQLYASADPCGASAVIPAAMAHDDCADCASATVIAGYQFLGTLNGSNYYIGASALTWFEAHDQATSVGGHLVSIGS